MTGAMCRVELPVQIGNQTDQDAACFLPAGHDGHHRAVVLDSDDNAIVHTYSTPTPAVAS